MLLIKPERNTVVCELLTGDGAPRDERRLLSHLLVVAGKANHHRQHFEQAVHKVGGMGSGEWGMANEYFPLPTPPLSPFPYLPPGASARFSFRFDRGRGFGLKRILVRDDRPVLLEVEVRAVIVVVADQTALVFRRRFVISGGRRLDVFGAGAVTRFAMDVGELRRGLYADEPLVAVTERMAADAVAIKRSLLLIQNGERMRMARIFPGQVFVLVALGAGFRKRERRIQQLPGHRLGLLFGQSRLNHVNLFASFGRDLGHPRIVGDDSVQFYVSRGEVVDN